MGRGTHRGVITFDELNKSLGKRNLSDENLEQAFINILDANAALAEKKSNFKVFLENEYEISKNYKSELTWFEGAWSRFKPGLGKDKRGVSGVDKNKLVEIGRKINSVPNNFNLHKTLKKILDLRIKVLDEGKAIDWSTAESLAFGTLLTEGFSVRLSGQDSGRGTFSQRHAVLRNQESHERYIPLNNLSNSQKKFEIIDSLLSE